MAILPDQLEWMQRMADEDRLEPDDEMEKDPFSECDGPTAVLQMLCEDEERRIARAKRFARLRNAGIVLAAFVMLVVLFSTLTGCAPQYRVRIVTDEADYHCIVARDGQSLFLDTPVEGPNSMLVDDCRVILRQGLWQREE